jgi:hypothetical protein
MDSWSITLQCISSILTNVVEDSGRMIVSFLPAEISTTLTSNHAVNNSIQTSVRDSGPRLRSPVTPRGRQGVSSSWCVTVCPTCSPSCHGPVPVLKLTTERSCPLHGNLKTESLDRIVLLMLSIRRTCFIMLLISIWLLEQRQLESGLTTSRQHRSVESFPRQAFPKATRLRAVQGPAENVPGRRAVGAQPRSALAPFPKTVFFTF